MERRPGCRAAEELGCRVVSISIQTDDGEVVMESCSACEQRWWSVAGTPVSFDQARGPLATTHRR